MAGPEMVCRARLERELLVLLFGLVVLFSLGAIVDPDLPGHIAYGRDHLASGQLPSSDPYSYSTRPGEVWVNHEWVFELLSAFVFARLGGVGLVLLQAVAWSTAGLVVLYLVRRATRDLVPGAVVYLLFAALAFAAITIRPQLFTYVLFALLLLLLEAARAGRVWTLVPAGLLFLPWVNLHGGFLAGLGVLGLYALGLGLDALLGRDAPGDLARSPRRPWLLFGAAAGACGIGAALTLVNPYGLGLHRFLLESLGRPRPQISEWRGVVLDAQGILFLIFATVSAWALLARPRARTPLPHVLVLVVTCVLAVRHARHVPFFAMSAAAFVPGALSDLYRRRVPPPKEDLAPADLRRMRLLYALLLLPALGLNAAWPHRDLLGLRLHPAGNSPFPTGAVRFIEEERVSGNLLVHFDWAQLLIWKFHPRIRVFYDGRFRTVYSAEVEEAFFAFTSHEGVPGWQRALEDYPTDLVLLPHGRPVTQRMRAEPGWRVAYEDTQAVLFARRRPGEKEPATVFGEHPPPILPFRPEDASR